MASTYDCVRNRFIEGVELVSCVGCLVCCRHVGGGSGLGSESTFIVACSVLVEFRFKLNVSIEVITSVYHFERISNLNYKVSIFLVKVVIVKHSSNQGSNQLLKSYVHHVQESQDSDVEYKGAGNSPVGPTTRVSNGEHESGESVDDLEVECVQGEANASDQGHHNDRGHLFQIVALSSLPVVHLEPMCVGQLLGEVSVSGVRVSLLRCVLKFGEELWGENLESGSHGERVAREVVHQDEGDSAKEELGGLNRDLVVCTVDHFEREFRVFSQVFHSFN